MRPDSLDYMTSFVPLKSSEDVDFQMPSTKSSNEECGVAFQPWFLDHVRTSLVKKDFSSLYFTVGLVEEVAELMEEKQKNSPDDSSVVSEVGDVCWYIYGLCHSLNDILPTTIKSKSDVSNLSPLGDEAAQALLLCGKLCGSVKKWNRGDQNWDQFRERIQKDVSDVLGVLASISPVPLEVAMKKNIEKIQSRRERNVVKGDGSDR